MGQRARRDRACGLTQARERRGTPHSQVQRKRSKIMADVLPSLKPVHTTPSKQKATQRDIRIKMMKTRNRHQEEAGWANSSHEEPQCVNKVPLNPSQERQCENAENRVKLLPWNSREMGHTKEPF